jgi:5-carboxymethyl-2-hydroxymuconate isomerase
MPHLILHYSANLRHSVDWRLLLRGLHQKLAEITGTDIANFKGRAFACDDFIVGDGAPDRAFAHLDVRLLRNRTPEVKRDVAEAALALLRAHMQPGLEGVDWQVSVDLLDLDEMSYRKTAGGHAS